MSRRHLKPSQMARIKDTVWRSFFAPRSKKLRFPVWGKNGGPKLISSRECKNSYQRLKILGGFWDLESGRKCTAACSDSSGRYDTRQRSRVCSGLALGAIRLRRIFQEHFNRDFLSAPDTQAVLSPYHPLQCITQLRGCGSRSIRENMGLKHHGKHLVRRWIGLSNDAPHPELIENLEKRLVVVLPQRAIELTKHCELECAEICYA